MTDTMVESKPGRTHFSSEPGRNLDPELVDAILENLHTRYWLEISDLAERLDARRVTVKKYLRGLRQIGEVESLYFKRDRELWRLDK